MSLNFDTINYSALMEVISSTAAMLKKPLKESIMVHLSKPILFLAQMLYIILSMSWSMRPPEKNSAKKFQSTYSFILLMILFNFAAVFFTSSASDSNG